MWCLDGSSPLARGLPRVQAHRPRRGRIIPARAGFTARWRAATVAGPGSSPLARGLRGALPDDVAPARIIPARAGFTGYALVRTPSRRDHPRSRGVYGLAVTNDGNVCGSSPLARGLPEITRDTPSARGIIPARAGFTCRSWTPLRTAGDHPRSRGVYSRPRGYGVGRRGSSPLARGLLIVSDGEEMRLRIIPARAGFTTTRRPSWRPSTDHPRSRGVYRTRMPRSKTPQGSSPLARGLRARPPTHTRMPRIIPARAGFTFSPDGGGAIALWIIPARAGFTPGSVRPPAGAADHPRSRGVYPRRSRAGPPPGGSSPLARGLRDGPGGGAVEDRIIPARAGFTPWCAASPSRTADHPRSRGVYRTRVSASGPSNGSSPLARGLLASLRRGRPSARIIPARAGFTTPSCRPTGTTRDHPRSRGVYETILSKGYPARGSSPLARGLRYKPRSWAGYTRIIPARAGFTMGSFQGWVSH